MILKLMRCEKLKEKKQHDLVVWCCGKCHSIMIKPDMSKVHTYPNIYMPYETYIPCKLDWSDLNDQIQYVLDNYNECKDITENARQIMKKSFTIENLLLYWYNLIKTFNGVAA